MYAHYRDSNFSGKRGDLAEKNFETKILRMTSIERSTVEENKCEHWDFKVSNKKIDVKSVKRWNRWGQYSDDVCLEINGEGKSCGWLRGQADFIAFEQPNGSFLLFSRAKLLDYVLSHLLSTEIYPHHSHEYYKIYRRDGKYKEEFVWVPISDLISSIKSITLN